MDIDNVRRGKCWGGGGRGNEGREWEVGAGWEMTTMGRKGNVSNNYNNKEF